MQAQDSELKTGPAVRVWEGTNIDRLATHYLVDGHAMCSSALLGIFEDSGSEVTCKRCLKAAGEVAR